MPTKVLLADRQQLAVEGIKQILTAKSDFLVTGVTEDFFAMADKVKTFEPELLVLDFHTVKNFSYSLFRQLIARFPSMKVFIISSANERTQIMQFLEMGVMAFLTKDCSREEISSAFTSVASGQKFYCNRVLDLLVENKAQQKKGFNNEILNEREIRIIRYISEGLSSSEMANKMCLSTHTINSYRKGILKKMEAKTPVEMIVKAFRMQILDV